MTGSEIQKYFAAFNERISIKRDEERSILLDRRDKLITSLRDGLEKRGAFKLIDYFTQGSYAMFTGIKPISQGKELDIDVGIVLDFESYLHLPSPSEVKTEVARALTIGFRKVEIRRSCITVRYDSKKEIPYHVDIAVDRKRKNILYLAKGKQNSDQSNQEWQLSDPRAFIQLIKDTYTGIEAQQFHRLVRYLKRWRDLTFADTGHSAPVGVALTVMALQTYSPRFTTNGTADDFSALRTMVSEMVDYYFRIRLIGIWQQGRVYLPVTPQRDLLGRMTTQQNQHFRERLFQLKKELDSSAHCETVEDTHFMLQKVFGQEI